MLINDAHCHFFSPNLVRTLGSALQDLTGDAADELPARLGWEASTSAEALADRVCVMAHGKVISEGSVAALRARVARKRVWCATRLALADVAVWPEVSEACVDGERLCLSTEHVETVVRRLLAHDADLSGLEVRAAGLAEAFTELTRDADAAVASLREAA